MAQPPLPPGLPPGAQFSPSAVPGVRIMPPPRPPAAGETLLGYYVITKTAGPCQCADLTFCGCFSCTFFALWFWTIPISFLICLINDCHTGIQFPVYGPPPYGHDPNAWTQGPPPGWQPPPDWQPPPPPPGGYQVPQGPSSLSRQFSSQNPYMQPEPATGIPMTEATVPPPQQGMSSAKAEQPKPV